MKHNMFFILDTCWGQLKNRKVFTMSCVQYCIYLSNSYTTELKIEIQFPEKFGYIIFY